MYQDDYAHIERVYNVAMNIASVRKLTKEEYEIIALSALLHDIADWKYSGSETAGVEAAKNYLVIFQILHKKKY